MALPRGPHARLFYQASMQRLEDARFLLAGGRTTAALYLAGYAVECMLKALILSRVTAREQPTVAASFRGSKAHDFGWLRAEYLAHGGAAFPKTVGRSFSLVNTWSTVMRYRPGTVKRRDAIAFVEAAGEIVRWADGRL